jgi:transcriptional antiterminator Rof (Rho-off)
VTDAYEPIDCSLHDRFEAAAVLHDRVRVEWTVSEEEPRTVEGTIRDIAVREGAEYLVMSDGSKIRLDRIRAFSTVR